MNVPIPTKVAALIVSITLAVGVTAQAKEKKHEEENVNSADVPAAVQKTAKGQAASSPETSLSSSKQAAADAGDEPIGGNFWDGVTHVARSPYLFALLLFIVFYTLTSTWTYFQQADLTRTAFASRGARTAFFARLDLSVNTLTLLLQIFLTGRLMKSVGITFTLLFMPVLSLFGFVAIGLSPGISMLAVFQVARRASTFAFMRPAREVLFTVLRRVDKYKAKSFIDTFGYRCGDQLGAWTYSALRAFGLGLNTISYLAVPVVAIWCVIGVWLGRRQKYLASQREEGDATTAVTR
jgi:AAA family ATP:ADP antiporter